MVPAAANWASEPTNVLGVSFDQPLESQMQECPKDPKLANLPIPVYDVVQINALHKSCFEFMASDSEFRPLKNLPDIGVFYEATAHIVGKGDIAAILLNIQHDRRREMLDLLVAKYGEPPTVLTQRYTSLAAAVQEGKLYEWLGKKVSILFSEYGSTLDQSVVTISVNALLGASGERSRANAEKNKDKL